LGDEETFVMLRVDEYERLTEEEYDDSPWTREELQALAWEIVQFESRHAGSQNFKAVDRSPQGKQNSEKHEK
jgi:hypothetical protein